MRGLAFKEVKCYCISAIACRGKDVAIYFGAGDEAQLMCSMSKNLVSNNDISKLYMCACS